MKNYEEHNFRYSQNEKKLKVQIAQKEKEIKHLETKFGALMSMLVSFLHLTQRTVLKKLKFII